MNATCNGDHLAALRHAITTATAKKPTPLTSPLQLQHGWLVPLMLDIDAFLWRRWTHWCETTTAGHIIAAIPTIEWQRHQAGFAMLDRTLCAVTGDGDWRGWSSWSSFDYFMDWLLFAFGHRGQPELPQEPSGSPGASERLYQTFNLETLLAFPYDYFGEILAENRHGRHLGFYPTPMHVSTLMAEMTLGEEDARDKTVCDPCVGTGRMLLAASNRSYRLYGCDINPTVIKATLVNGYLYAPWLVRPFPFLDGILCDPAESLAVSDSIAAQGNAQNTEHDAREQWKFEPIKKRRIAGEPMTEQGILF